MRPKAAATLLLLFALMPMASQASWPDELSIAGSREACGEACEEEPASGCTVFTLVKGDQVFFGGNDDFVTLDSYYWVDPGSEGRYGVIWVGTPDNVQQGVNEMGLAYDGNGLPRIYTNPHPERIPVPASYSDYPIQILRSNATVAEVIDWVQSHQRAPFMHDQLQFADATGDAVVISPGQDGELIFTRKPRGNGFLISTNFNVADPGHGTVSWRYSTAQQVLDELMVESRPLSPEDAASVLDATHDEGSDGWTRSSMLADLPNGKVYLYYFHQFDKPIVLDVVEQLANPPEPGALSELFPHDVQQEAERRYQRFQSQSSRCRLLGAGWLVIVAASLIGFATLGGESRSGSAFWWLVILIMGPIGLASWAVSSWKGGTTRAQKSLTEATGDLAPTVLGFLLALMIANADPSNQQSDAAYLLLLLGLPLVLGLLVFHGPLLAPIANTGYVRLVWRRLPHLLAVTLLGVAGLTAVAIPLAEMASNSCPVADLSDPALGLAWASMAVGSVVGGFLLFAYQMWAGRRGYAAWAALISDETEFSTPGWRQLWWWILLAIAALIAGSVVNQYLLGL